MSQADVIEVAAQLYHLERSRTTAIPITDRFRAMDLKDAYDIQSAYIHNRVRNDGATRLGMKVGCTSTAIQQAFGINQPDFGVLLDDMLLREGEAISVARLIQPMVEPEIAFCLGTDLRGPGVTVVDALASTATVAPCLEIIDSRIQDWNIRLFDTVADNGSSALFVLGSAVALDDAPNLAEVGVRFSTNGEQPLRASGRAVLGHPAAAVAWLANTLGRLGDGLRAGDVVLSGSFTAAQPCRLGDNFAADFDHLGSICATVAA